MEIELKKEWFYIQGTDQFSTTIDDLIIKLRSGELNSDTLIWRRGKGNWLTASNYPELWEPIRHQSPAQPNIQDRTKINKKQGKMCKYCKNIIMKSTEVCPNCGSRVKQSLFARIVIGVMGLFILIIIMSLVFGNNDKKEKVEETKEINEVSSTELTTTELLNNETTFIEDTIEEEVKTDNIKYKERINKFDKTDKTDNQTPTNDTLVRDYNEEVMPSVFTVVGKWSIRLPSGLINESYTIYTDSIYEDEIVNYSRKLLGGYDGLKHVRFYNNLTETPDITNYPKDNKGEDNVYHPAGGEESIIFYYYTGPAGREFINDMFFFNTAGDIESLMTSPTREVTDEKYLTSKFKKLPKRISTTDDILRMILLLGFENNNSAIKYSDDRRIIDITVPIDVKDKFAYEKGNLILHIMFSLKYIITDSNQYDKISFTIIDNKDAEKIIMKIIFDNKFLTKVGVNQIQERKDLFKIPSQAIYYYENDNIPIVLE